MSTRAFMTIIALATAVLCTRCTSKKPPSTSVPVPPSVNCPGFPAGIPTRTLTVSLPTPASRSLRRSIVNVGGGAM